MQNAVFIFVCRAYTVATWHAISN